MEIDAVEFREVVFVTEGGHVLFAAAINQVHDFGAEAFRGSDYVNGGVAGADARDAAADGELREGANFCRLDELHGADYALQIFAGDAEIAGIAEADTDEDGVEIFFELGEGGIAADGGLLAKFDSEAADELDFAQGIFGAEFVGGDAVGVQAAGEFIAIENRGAIAELGEFGGAGKRCGAGSDKGDTLAIGNARVEKLNIAIEDVVHGVALQAADFDGFFFLLVHHAGAFAENFGGANAAAAVSQDIGFENYAGGAAQIVGGDFFYERGDVNVCGAGDGAGRVKAEKAAGGLDGGLARGHARRYFGEVFLVLFGRKLGSRLAQRHELAVVPLGWKRDAILALGIAGRVKGFAEEFEATKAA